ncbi:MAG: ComF family protein, partial [Candidatus Fermentibacteraceae bacterium]|nr:ComF family protein [Candidatus Fermentibacteraceae bacterium]
LRVDPCRRAHWSGDGSVIRGTSGSMELDDEGMGVPVFSAVLYAGLPGEMLRRLKFKGEKHLASAAADLILLHSRHLPGQGDTIVPVPAGRKRKRERGYNQAALIARRLSKRTGAGVCLPLARDDGPSQLGLSTRQRRKNVEGVFHLRRGRQVPGGSTIWLVDDVATTFSTIHGAAMVLLEGGAGKVLGLTLAYRRKTADSIIRTGLSRN